MTDTERRPGVRGAAVSGRAATDTERRPGVRGAAWAALPLLAGLLAAAAVAAIAIGSTGIAWGTVVRVLAARALPAGWIDLGEISEAEQVIVWLIRTPRVAVAALVGGALAVAGTQMQGLFRNPLAEPSVIGISQGAALGAVVTFVSGLAAAAVFWLPLFAFLGALAALATVYAVATRAGRTPVATLLLAGIALGSLSTAVATLLISLSVVNWQVANEVVFWLMGGLDNRTWTHVWMCLPPVALGAVAARWHTRDLDLLLLGEESAASLGVDVERVRRTTLATAAMLTGAAVAVSGVIGFVGLIVPHMLRLVLGPSHRTLLPAAMLGGALFVIVCDLLARTVNPPTEIRLGIITAACGAPFFLYLLRRQRGGVAAL